MEAETLPLLLASDAGYGFRSRFSDLFTKNRNGKAVLSLPKNAQPLEPLVLSSSEKDLLAAVTNEGRLLIFPVAELPELSRGKGNKIIQIPPTRAKKREELLIHLCVLAAGDQLVIHSGKRHLTLKPGNLADFSGPRGRRGRKLPRGFRNVDRLSVVLSAQKNLL